MSESLQVQLKKGVLEMCVLALLSGGDNYAYEIASRMADAVGMGEGTVYPLMRRLQNEGLVTTYLVESASGPPRTVRSCTIGRAPCRHSAAAAMTACVLSGVLTVTASIWPSILSNISRKS